jgi:Major Facilitator Superfamily.
MLDRVKKLEFKLNYYSLIQALFWAAIACYSPYIVLFLSKHGVSNSLIGIIMMGNSIVSLLLQPFWGMVSDRIRSIRKVFIFCLGLTAVLIIALAFVKSILFMGILIILISAIQSPLGALLDIWTLNSVKIKASKSYGAVRMWGSFGYAVLVICMGALIDTLSVSYVFYCYGFMSIVVIFACYKITDVNKNDDLHEKHSESGFSSKSILKLLKNKQYTVYLAFICLIFTVINPMISFLPQLMLGEGGSNDLYGLSMAIAAMSEAPILFISGYLVKRFRSIILVYIALIFYVIRIVIFVVVPNPTGIIVSMCLQGFSYAIFLAGYIQYIDEITPEGLKSTAMTFGNSVSFGLSGIIGYYAGGSLIDGYGIFNAYKFGAVYMVILFAVFSLYLLYLFVHSAKQNKKIRA